MPSLQTLLANRTTYLTAAALILTGIGTALGVVDSTTVAITGPEVTYDTVDHPAGSGASDTVVGIVSALLGLLGARQRAATRKVQDQLAALTSSLEPRA